MPSLPITASIIEKLRIADLPPEAQDEMLASLGTLLFKSVTLRLFETLPEEKKETLMSLIHEENGEELKAFFNESVPNFDEIVTNELRVLGEDLSAAGL